LVEVISVSGVCVAGIFEEDLSVPGVASVDSPDVVRRGEVGEGIDDHGAPGGRERERRKPREPALESLGNW
jgi:hypothetical protein